jgi:hypothetical protein
VENVASATNEPTTRSDDAIEREIGELADHFDPVPQSVIDAAQDAFSSRSRDGSRGRPAKDEPARSR